MAAAQHLTRPLDRAVGDRAEIVQLFLAGTGAIVIPANAYAWQLADSLDDFVWIGGVADRVAEVPHGVVRRRRFKAGDKSFEVGVYVRDDKSAHLRTGLSYLTSL